MDSSYSIQVYTDDGVSPICLSAWKRTIREEVDDRRYKIDDFKKSYSAGFDRGNVALVLIPGGNANDMIDPCYELAYKMNEAISNNSAFLGSCAGAMVTFARSDTSSLLFHPRYNFNPIPYSAKYYMPSSEEVTDPLNRVAINAKWISSDGIDSRPCQLFHAYGPVFPLECIPLDVKDHCRSLVDYTTRGTGENIEHPSAAVLYRPNTGGPRLLTGIHPEIGEEDVLLPDFKKNYDLKNQLHVSHVNNLASTLKDNERIRKEMCRSWLLHLGITLKKV